MATTVYSKTGSKKDSAVTLDKAIFGIEANAGLVTAAYQAYLNNGRSAAANVKNRGDVRGGGQKPWRQKGTGRARVGSSRVPNWRGGGVVFGPTGLENYEQNLPTKMKRSALRHALSLQAKDGKVAVIEAFEAAEGKVKATIDLFAKMGLVGSVLLVLDAKNDLADRATRNISGVKAIEAKYLNVYEIMNADNILFSQKSLDILSDWLGEAKKAPKAEPASEKAAEPKAASKPAPKAKAGAAA